MLAAEEGSEEWYKYRDAWLDSLNDLNSAVETSMERIINIY